MSIGDNLTGLIISLTPEGELRVALGDDDTQQVPCNISRDTALRITEEFLSGHAAGRPAKKRPAKTPNVSKKSVISRSTTRKKSTPVKTKRTSTKPPSK